MDAICQAHPVIGLVHFRMDIRLRTHRRAVASGQLLLTNNQSLTEHVLYIKSISQRNRRLSLDSAYAHGPFAPPMPCRRLTLSVGGTQFSSSLSLSSRGTVAFLTIRGNGIWSKYSLGSSVSTFSLKDVLTHLAPTSSAPFQHTFETLCRKCSGVPRDRLPPMRDSKPRGTGRVEKL